MQKKIVSSFQKFINIESFSGILLLGATIIALAWANSAFGESYQALWQYKIGIVTENFELNKPILLWINDGLMAIFFFLIGLEIKREFLIGELNSTSKLAFPLVGALGGMIIPVILFVVINQNPETLRGWGIPMATDIAFSLAILKVLGNRVPLSLKIFLTAFAIVDDLGAVLVIAVFYSGSIDIILLLIALVLLAFLYFLSFKNYYTNVLLVVFGVAIWILFLKSGIHPTLAGVLLAFSVPIRQKIETPEYLDNLELIVSNIKSTVPLKSPILTVAQIEEIDALENWTEKFRSPLQHMENRLHNWVAYFIIPIFALANAGVLISGEIDLEMLLVINIIACLVIGKSVGISSMVLLAKRLKLITIPSDISNLQIIGVSFLAGIGFTMAIFIGGLAFADNPYYIDSAKIGILIGSLISAVVGFIILKAAPKQINKM